MYRIAIAPLALIGYLVTIGVIVPRSRGRMVLLTGRGIALFSLTLMATLFLLNMPFLLLIVGIPTVALSGLFIFLRLWIILWSRPADILRACQRVATGMGLAAEYTPISMSVPSLQSTLRIYPSAFGCLVRYRIDSRLPKAVLMLQVVKKFVSAQTIGKEVK